MSFIKILLSCFLLLEYFVATSQNVGIGITNPVEKLEVNGGVKIGLTNNLASGTIRWNDTISDFQGYNGKSWVSLTGGKSSWGSQSNYSTENYATIVVLNSNNYYRGQQLGHAIGTKGDWLVAGVPYDVDPDQNIDDFGSIRIFKRQGNEWINKWSIENPGFSSDHFGKSIGLTATHIIAGADYNKVGDNNEQGKAYIFLYTDQTIVSQATLMASDGAAFDHFGNTSAIDGIYAAVGAPMRDIAGQGNVGGVYIYTRNGTFWPQTKVLGPIDGTNGDGFGTTIALSGSYLAIASPGKTVNGVFNAGKVYAYKYSQALLDWVLIAQIQSPNLSTDEFFGRALCFGDNKLFVGAPGVLGGINTPPGKVYVYGVNDVNSTISYQTLVTSPDVQVGDGFGASIACLDSTMLIGSKYADVGAGNDQGKAYAFKRTGGQWIQQAILTSSSNESTMWFGASVALTPGYGIVGAPRATLNNVWSYNGKIFFFQR